MTQGVSNSALEPSQIYVELHFPGFKIISIIYSRERDKFSYMHGTLLFRGVPSSGFIYMRFSCTSPDLPAPRKMRKLPLLGFGVPFGAPHNKERNISGYVGVPLIYGNYHMSYTLNS